MSYCYKCGAQNESEATSCVQCGSNLAYVGSNVFKEDGGPYSYIPHVGEEPCRQMPYCPDCGTRVSKTAKFCRECGCKLTVAKNERGNPMSSGVTNKPVSPDIQNNLNSHHYKSEPLSLEKTHEYRRPEDAYGQVYINGITRCVLMVRYLLLPLEMVTTVALGIVIGIPPIGIVYCLIMTIIWAPFFGYMAGISWLCKKLPLLGIPLSIIGIPLVLVIDIFLQLMPNPDKEDKANKAIICSNYPLSVLPEMIEP